MSFGDFGRRRRARVRARGLSQTVLIAPAVAAVSLVSGFLLSRVALDTAGLLVVATALVLLAPIAVRLATRRFDPFEPVFVFALAYGVMFVARPASILHTHDFVYGISGQGIGIEATFTQTALLGLIGALGFIAGHESRIGRRIARRAKAPISNVDFSLLVGIALAVATAGLCLYGMFLMRQGGLASVPLVLAGRSEELTTAVQGTSKFYLFGPSLLISVTIVITAVAMHRRQPSLYALAAAVGGILLLIAGPTGSRGTILPLVGGLCIYIYSTRRRRPRMLMLVLFGAVALTASSFILAVRSADERQAVGASGIGARLVDRPQTVLEPIYKGQDAAEAPALAAALTVVPSEMNWTYGGATIGDLLLRPVPRAIWEGKPQAPREAVIETLWPSLYRVGAANPEFSTLLFWYLDGGVIGVFVGLMLLGVVLRASYEWFSLHEQNMLARLLYATTLPVVIILLRDSPTDGIVRGAFIVIPVWIVFWLAGNRRRRFVIDVS